MTPAEIRAHGFRRDALENWRGLDSRYRNWPVVYVIDSDTKTQPAVYVGETVNVANRMKQHLEGGKKANLRKVRVILDQTFNKSVCLDLESHLIRWLAGDGQYSVMNRNEGVTDADYFGREGYRETFEQIFDELKQEGVFTRSIPEIENSDLFKLSPFKSLTQDQAIAVEDVMDGLLKDLGSPSTSIIEGQPGTDKTIVAIFLIKLIMDIRTHRDADEVEPDSIFSEYFVSDVRKALENFTVALVVPQQSLRTSIQKVFKKTPGLSADMVLSQWDVAKADTRYDLLLVDEAHRLNQRANQSSGVLNRDFRDINIKLFGADDPAYTQLDWLRERSTHQILLLDAAQSVRPADLPRAMIDDLIRTARQADRRFPLATQMRVKADADYVGTVRSFLRGDPVRMPDLGEYDFRIFDDFGEMRRAIFARDEEDGLARIVAGYAWKWISRKGGPTPEAHDMVLDGVGVQWNKTDKDWINSSTSLHEVGSIHTTQGYDLNYAGVVIGPDLRYVDGQFVTHRDWIADVKGKENNKNSGHVYSDQDLLDYIINIYGVLLTRGVRGTYVYACDPGVRERLRQLLQA